MIGAFLYQNNLGNKGVCGTFHLMEKDLKNLNVLQVTAALHEGGVERGTVEMSRFLVAQNCGSFVASAGGQMVPELLKDGGVHFQLPLKNRNPVSIIYSALRLVTVIQRNNIKLVHARSRAPAWAAFLAAKWTNTPFVTTFHGTHKIQNNLKKFYNSSMVRGERVIAISQFIKDHVVKHYGVDPQKVGIAHRGVDSRKFDPSALSQAEIDAMKKAWHVEDKLVITLPGRLTRWKGQVPFIKALEELKGDPSWHALIVGGAGKKTAYKKELENLIEQLGLKTRVTLTGGQANIPPFYAMSDVIVSASSEPEAFGRVAIEAGAMKKPVIATAHGGSLETVQHEQTGLLVPVDDVETMAKMLRGFLKGDYNKGQMGEKAYAWVQNTFTVEKMCQAEWEAYHKILGEES